MTRTAKLTTHTNMHARPASSRRIQLLSCSLISVLCVLTLTSCSIPIPQAEADPTRFFVLNSSGVATQHVANAPSVQLAPVELASYLRTRPLIVRHGTNEIQFREFARWGEPLENGIARVLREELLARGAASAMTMRTFRAAAEKTDYALSVRVLACEGDAEGNVIFRAVWELSANEPEKKSVGGEYNATGLRWNGKDEATLAAQISLAVTGLATEIAAGLKK